MLTEQIRCLEQLVQIDKRADNDQTAEDAPQPEGGGADAVVDAAAGRRRDDWRDGGSTPDRQCPA